MEESNVNINQGAEPTISYLLARLTMEKYLNNNLPAINLRKRTNQFQKKIKDYTFDELIPAKLKKSESVLIIVAHPDDETLWAGGTILNHPEWKCYIISLCRAHDPDRAPRFFKVLKILKAQGILGDLDDSHEQKPLDLSDVQNLIRTLLPSEKFDRIINDKLGIN